MNNKQLGNIGEQYAKDFLEQKGYQTLASNWRNKHGEIDLVMLTNDKILVFVEVKLRTSNIKGTGMEAVDYRKVVKIHQIAQMFLMKNRNYLKHSIRLDVISIIYDKKTQKVIDLIHVENI